MITLCPTLHYLGVSHCRGLGIIGIKLQLVVLGLTTGVGKSRNPSPNPDVTIRTIGRRCVTNAKHLRLETKSYKSQHGVDDPHWMQYPGPTQTNKQSNLILNHILNLAFEFAQIQYNFFQLLVIQLWENLNLCQNSILCLWGCLSSVNFAVNGQRPPTDNQLA